MIGSSSPKPSARRIGDLSLRWLAGVLVLSLVAVFGLRAVVGHFEERLRERGDNERARLFVGEEVVRGIRGIEKDVYRMAATQNRAGFERISNDIEAQLDKLMHDLNVLKFGGTVRQLVPLNLAEQEELTREATYRPDTTAGGYIMELVEIGPQIGMVRDRTGDLEQLLMRRWDAAEQADQKAFFEVEEEIGILLKKMPPYFARLDENANRLFLDGERKLRELELELKRQDKSLKQIETALIVVVILLTVMAVMVYMQRLSDALRGAREARDELERQREQIATMLDTLSDGVYATDLEGRITFMNAAAERILGWSAAELIGQPSHQAVHHTQPNGESFPREQCPLMRVIKEGVSLAGEEHFVGRDGRFIPVSYRSSPLRRKGDVSGYLVTFQDIGAQLESQARIRLQQSALDAAANMIVITSREGVIEYVNPAFSAVTGYSAEEVVGGKTSILRSGRQDNDFYAAMWAQVLSGRSWEGELVNRRKDGSLYQEQMTVTPILEGGQISHFIAVKRDISDEALTRTRLKLVEAAVLEADQGIMITDPEMTDRGILIHYVNPAFGRITGFSAEEAVGRHASLERGHHSDPATTGRIREAVAAGESFNVELDQVRKDGTSYIAEIRGSPVRDERGTISHYVILLSDISARRAFEAALREARDQALDSVRLKADFLSTMSHEIRTPMNGIIGMTDLLLDTGLSQEQREFATVVRDSATSLLTIINDILDFSKMDAGRLDIESTEYSPSQIVEGATELLVAKAKEKEIGLACYVDPALPSRLVGDPTRVRQVLLNLVGNAVKFTERGEVQVSAFVEHQEGRTRVRYEVRDTGIGIPRETQQRLFQSFTQADSTTTRKYGGTGLGLAISKRLVELMGGEIGVVSEAGQGATFWFALPLASFSGRSQAGAMHMLRRIGAPGRRALIVDSHDFGREVLRRYLVGWEIECVEVQSGAAAMALLSAAPGDGRAFDVVFVDASLPDMAAVALADLVRARPDLAAVRLVLITAYDQRELKEQARAHGFAACLIKPVRQAHLLDSLSDAPVGIEEMTDAEPLPQEVSGVMSLREALERRKLVLLVEDNPVNQRVAQLQINKLGYAVHTVANGQDAVDAVEALPYALVLMDCQMPIMDGFDATAAIRRAERGSGKRLPIVAMTANAMQGDREKCMAVGMDDYLSKPIDAVALAEALAKWVGPIEAEPAAPAAAGVVSCDGMALDTHRLKDLLGDDPEMLGEVLVMFRTSTTELLGKLESSVAGQDSDRVRALAHETKGASGNLGVDRMASVAAALEKAAVAADWSAAESLCQDLKAAFADASLAIDKFLEELRS